MQPSVATKTAVHARVHVHALRAPFAQLSALVLRQVAMKQKDAVHDQPGQGRTRSANGGQRPPRGL